MTIIIDQKDPVEEIKKHFESLSKNEQNEFIKELTEITILENSFLEKVEQALEETVKEINQ